jgi:hypothetical protein
MTPELIEAVAVALGCTTTKAAQVIEAARPLWDALEPHVDGYGGAEFERVFPVAIAAINREANGAGALGL